MSLVSHRDSHFHYISLFFILLLAIPAELPGQSREDSLFLAITKLPDDTSKVNRINKHCLEILNDNYERGLALAREALVISKKLNYPKGKAFALEHVGTYYWYNGYYEQAANYFNQAIHLGKSFNANQLLAETYNRLGLVYYYQAKYDSANVHHLKSLAWFREMGDSLGVARIWYHIGLLHYHQSNYDLAVDYYLRALDFYEAYGTPLNQASMLNKLGEVYMAIGQTELVWEKKQEVLDLASKASGVLNQAQFHEQIGDIYFLLDAYDSALTYFRKAAREFKGMGHTNYYDFICEKIGKIYLSRGDCQTALEYLNRVYEIRKTNGTRIHKASIEGNLGEVYKHARNWAAAIEHYSRGLSMHLEMGNAISIAKTYTSLAEIYFKSGAVEKAIENASLGLKSAQAISSLSLEIDNLKILSDAYLAQRNFERAVHFLGKYHDQKKALAEGKTLQRISHLQMQYQDEKNERKIAQLRQKEILQKAELHQRNMLVIIFFILLLFILSVSILLYNQYKLKAKNNELLSRKNREIVLDNVQLNRKNREGEVLLAEIRHRIKNNLQTISSLLNLHSRQLSQQQQSLIQESHDRVRAMVLVHQKLHQDTQYAYIELGSYLKELAENLIISYGRSDLKVRYQLPSISIEANSAIYIGLITNELISNSLKHAYDGIPSPQLSISIKRTGENSLRVKVKDNGKGFSGKTKKPDSFGVRLIAVLVGELKGELTFDDQDGTEAVVSMQCPIWQETAEPQEVMGI